MQNRLQKILVEALAKFPGSTMKTVAKSPFNSLQQLKHGLGEDDTYWFLHEDRCDGHVVAVVPFRQVDGEDLDYEYLLLPQVTQCWTLENPVYSSFTGGVDAGEDPVTAAVREFGEESGYQASIEKFIPLGTCYASKSSSTLYHLFSVDLTNKEPAYAFDQAEVDEGITRPPEWLPVPTVAEDAIVYVIAWRLMQMLYLDV